MRDSQNYQYQEENSIFRKSKYYPRSQSFSPFQERTGKRRSIIEQQKNYAKFLEAQVLDSFIIHIKHFRFETKKVERLSQS